MIPTHGAHIRYFKKLKKKKTINTTYTTHHTHNAMQHSSTAYHVPVQYMHYTQRTQHTPLAGTLVLSHCGREEILVEPLNKAAHTTRRTESRGLSTPSRVCCFVHCLQECLFSPTTLTAAFFGRLPQMSASVSSPSPQSSSGGCCCCIC